MITVQITAQLEISDHDGCEESEYTIITVKQIKHL